MSEKLPYHRPTSRPPADDPVLRIMQTTGGTLLTLVGLVCCVPIAVNPRWLRTDDGVATAGIGLLSLAAGLILLINRMRAWLRRTRG